MATECKVYVGNLAWSTTSATLQAEFSKCGQVIEAIVQTEHRDENDPHPPRSRGFGFVLFSKPEEAENAIATMNNATIDGRPVRVNNAHEPTNNRSFRNNDRGGFGGYRGAPAGGFGRGNYGGAGANGGYGGGAYGAAAPSGYPGGYSTGYGNNQGNFGGSNPGYGFGAAPSANPGYNSGAPYGGAAANFDGSYRPVDPNYAGGYSSNSFSPPATGTQTGAPGGDYGSPTAAPGNYGGAPSAGYSNYNQGQYGGSSY